ncbi:MAG: serine protease [Anaerolineae bacterium]|nr:serine protease [Anaerolineae bacterium]
MTRFRNLLVGMLMCLVLIRTNISSTAQNIDLELIQQATVFIIQAEGSNLSTRCIGSGTIVRYDGLILTNAHNVVPSATCLGEELIIAMTLNPNDPPVPKYRAEIAQVDESYDLALLRITRELDGRLIEADELPILPFVEIARTESISLDETITVVGYPDVGNDAVQSIRGTITGFIAEPDGGEQAWIKTVGVEAFRGTMSGGGAYNQEGQLIGVPTSAPLVQQVGENCRLLEDTNGDGFINANDACIPIGDAISVLRPATFALPLVRSASLGLDVNILSSLDTSTTISETPTVDRLFFATAVTNGLPNRVIGSAPTGTNSLYLFFDYRNFTSNTVYELRVTIDGIPSPTFSLPPVRWSGNNNGLWYIGSSGIPWANGSYEFRLFVNGFAAASRFITVGGSPQEQPTFSNVVFGLLDDNNNLQGESYILPTGNIASARFIYQNMTLGTQWTSVWYYNGIPLNNPVYDSWSSDDGISGSRDDVSIRPDGGLRPGNYRVDLYIVEDGDARLKTTGDFVVAGAPAGALPDVFSNIEFRRTDSPFAQPTGTPAISFPDGANTIFAQFNWQRISGGTLWTIQWLVDGTLFYEETLAWNAPDSGNDFTIRLTASDGLPDATYTMNLLINGILLETAQVSVGIGQLSIDNLAAVGGIQLRGQVIDGDTQEGIEGVTFVLISEDYSIADFTWQQDQIYALAVTDQNGDFEIDRPLQFEAPYSVYVLVEGYLPITQDGFAITQERFEEVGGNPIEMLIPMTKD